MLVVLNSSNSSNSERKAALVAVATRLRKVRAVFQPDVLTSVGASQSCGFPGQAAGS